MPLHKLQTPSPAHIISLIRDDLVNYKLISSLNDLGLDAHEYYLHLNETIFELVGIDENKSDAVFENYFRQLKKVKRLSIKNSGQAFDLLAENIYKGLVIEASE